MKTFQGRFHKSNLKDDIGEKKNLVESMPEKVAEMKAQLAAALKEHGAMIPSSNATKKRKR